MRSKLKKTTGARCDVGRLKAGAKGRATAPEACGFFSFAARGQPALRLTKKDSHPRILRNLATLTEQRGVIAQRRSARWPTSDR